ncbi:DUF1700 domain-containing protein [Peptoniphilus sp. oral taxon 386]|uniref:DUF1700 domain-containing protein n=1 Tax=Peptoniphilus sp. oral taxon 386 TaxID=652713 RepID=UPI0001DA998F|nr:DUF1700 domain-containing protein [Peptoniphilus sp. oral taxon 386]EFI41425.1 hypothetical protein HMPREF0629_00044 [Peptoniphilus sp. oral taxon 386 str. F0131]
MKKKEFLDLLRYYLKDMPRIVVDDIISDYEEHFSFAVERGKSEEQICDELGAPELIAKDYMKNEGKKLKVQMQDYDYTENREKKKKSSNDTLLIILIVIGGIIFLGPILGVGMGIFGAIFGLLASIIAIGGSFILVGLALPLSLIPTVIYPNFISIPSIFMEINPITKIFATISLITIGVLFIGLAIKLFKTVIKGIKNIFVAIRWKINKRREM